MTTRPYSIVITTFDQRFEPFLVPLLNSIRTLRPEVEIIVMANGPAKGTFDGTYRAKLLQFLSSQKNCFPTIFPNFQSLAKLWNRGVLTASNECVLVLNDDLSIDVDTSPHFFDQLESILQREHHTFKMNGSFSHFIINKTELIKVGFFDERLLGIGEEDGDFVWRYHETYDREIPSIDISGINNIQSKLADSGFIKGIGHYSKFNRDFIKNEKYKEVLLGGYKGMFDKRSKKKLEDEVQYPYEAFYQKYRNKL
jgi:hypothetical protein